jgi:hypothetical protein
VLTTFLHGWQAKICTHLGGLLTSQVDLMESRTHEIKCDSWVNCWQVKSPLRPHAHHICINKVLVHADEWLPYMNKDANLLSYVVWHSHAFLSTQQCFHKPTSSHIYKLFWMEAMKDEQCFHLWVGCGPPHLEHTLVTN